MLHLLSLAVLARILSPGDYGTLSMVTAIIGVATILGDFGLSMASIQSQTLSDKQRNNLFWINLGLGTVLGGLVFVLAGPISAFYGRPELAGITQVLASIYLLNAAAAQFRAETTRKLRFVWLASADVTAQAVSLGAAIAAAAAGFGYWALVVQQVVLATTTLVMLVISARWIPGLPGRDAGMRSLIGFGANTMGIQVINYASSNLDSVFIGRFWGATQLGFYDRAYQLFRLPLQQIAAPMTRVALPILSKLNGTPQYEKYIQRAQLLVAYVFGFIFFTAAALSDPLIEILLGPNWNESKPIFKILAIGGLFQGLGYVYYWIFLSRAMTGLQLRFTLWTRLIMIGLLAIGVIWGPIGVAFAATGGLALNWLVLTTLAIPKTGVNVRRLTAIAGRPILVYALMTAVVSTAAYFIQPWNVWLQLISLGGLVVACLALAFAVARPVRRDVGEIIDTARRMRR